MLSILMTFSFTFASSLGNCIEKLEWLKDQIHTHSTNIDTLTQTLADEATVSPLIEDEQERLKGLLPKVKSFEVNCGSSFGKNLESQLRLIVFKAQCALELSGPIIAEEVCSTSVKEIKGQNSGSSQVQEIFETCSGTKLDLEIYMNSKCLQFSDIEVMANDLERRILDSEEKIQSYFPDQEKD